MKIPPDKKREYNQRYYTRNKERAKRNAWLSFMKCTYGLTEEDFNRLLIQQEGKCAICKTPADEHPTRLHVDHSHTTLKVRGLLCQKCNRGLGLFNDNPEHLRTASEYLQKQT